MKKNYRKIRHSPLPKLPKFGKQVTAANLTAIKNCLLITYKLGLLDGQQKNEEIICSLETRLKYQAMEIKRLDRSVEVPLLMMKRLRNVAERNGYYADVKLIERLAAKELSVIRFAEKSLTSKR